MKAEYHPAALKETVEQTSLADAVKEWEETCQSCHPLTPTICLTNCKIWKLKNELRKLHEKLNATGFMTKLLNTLKNKRRLQILEIISTGKYSIARLQQEMKKRGLYHSRQTLVQQYIIPLIVVGLADEDQNRYHATIFGCRLNQLIKKFPNVEKILPSHSGCYEELVLNALLNGPKTYEDLEGVVITRSVARVLKRLHEAGLIDATEEKDYVFYFRTKRDLNRVRTSPTEKRVYENVSVDGIPARKLSEKTEISLRRTYKYLRRLKGKKLVFTRTRHKSYKLTDKGVQTASMLEGVCNLAMETLMASQAIGDVGTRELLVPAPLA